jgi:Protein of unknown function (DUF3987)/Toprim-like
VSPVERVLAALEARGLSVRPNGQGGQLARCPTHEDRSPSLSISVGEDERVLVHCFAGCLTEDIVEALGLEVRDLFPPDHERSRPPARMSREPAKSRAALPSEEQLAAWQRALRDHEGLHRRLVELRGWTREVVEALGLGYDGKRIVFPVKDASGQLVGVVRYRPGNRPDGERKILADPGSVRELWPAPESLNGTQVVLAEGESDAVSLATIGLPAVAVPGAASWRSEWASRFTGRDVIVCTDCDEPGRGLAERAADDLRQTAASVRVIDLDSNRSDGHDVGDLVRDAAEEGPDALIALKLRLVGMAEEAKPAAADWPSVSTRALPTFPVDALPPPVAAWVRATAEHTQTPADLPALAALGVLSGAALGGAVVDCGAWEEELGLYLLPAMPSGDRKSTVLRAATQPLRELERERAELAAPRIRELRSRSEVLEIRARNLTKQAAKENIEISERIEAEQELATVEAERESIGQPAIPRLLADDATPEALGGLLSKHGSIAVLAAESALIDNLAGRYSEGKANLHLVCAAYSGEPTTIDRKGHDPERLDRPLLTIALVVQPHVLEALIAHPTARAQGLVARFAYAMPETRLGRRKINAARVPREDTDAWAATVRRVAGTVDKINKTQEESHSSPPSVDSVDTFSEKRITLSPEASFLLTGLQVQMEPRLGPTDDLHPIADWAARHHGRVARIAGLLHLCEHAPSEPIAEQTMRAALQIGDYFLAHGVAALTGSDEMVRRALRWLRKHSKSTVTVRDLHGGPAAHGPVEQAESLARALETLGALRALPPDNRAGPGRKKSPAYAVNPELFSAAESSIASTPDAWEGTSPERPAEAFPPHVAAQNNDPEPLATPDEEALLERATQLIGGDS